MSSLLTAVILTSPNMEKVDYEHLLEIDYQDTRLVIVGTTTEYFALQKLLGPKFDMLNPVHCNIELTDSTKVFFEHIKTPYWTILTPYELIDTHFLYNTSQSLETIHPAYTSLIYLTGFLTHSNVTVDYSQFAVPELAKTLQYSQLFQSSLWFHPCVKIIFSTEITHSLNLIPCYKQQWWVDYQIFCIHYFASLYSIQNNTEPAIEYFPGAFLVPKFVEPTQNDLNQLRVVLLENMHIWQSTLWNKVYFSSALFAKKYSSLLKKSTKKI